MLLGVQILRGIAAISVVFHHFGVQYQRYGSGTIDSEFTLGAAGVDIFFVISGFIMIYITAKKGLSPRQFLGERIIRIAPLYWFYTLGMVVALLSIPSFVKSSKFELSHTINSFFFIPDYHPVFEEHIWPLLIQGWSLNYEVFFYAVFALALVLSHRRRFTYLLVILVTLVLIGASFTHENPVLTTYTNPLILEFLGGAAVGKIYLAGGPPKPQLGRTLVITSLLLFLLSTSELLQFGRVISWGIPSIMLLLGVLSLENDTSVQKLSKFKIVGDSSFSLYLSHTFILAIIGYIWSHTGTKSLSLDLAFLAISLLSCTLVGYLSFVLVEKPSARFLNKYRARCPDAQPSN